MNIELQNSNIFINEINKSLSDSLNVIIAKSSKQYEKLSNLAVSLESMKMPINQAVIEITVVNHLSDSQTKRFFNEFNTNAMHEYFRNEFKYYNTETQEFFFSFEDPSHYLKSHNFPPISDSCLIKNLYAVYKFKVSDSLSGENIIVKYTTRNFEINFDFNLRKISLTRNEIRTTFILESYQWMANGLTNLSIMDLLNSELSLEIDIGTNDNLLFIEKLELCNLAFTFLGNPGYYFLLPYNPVFSIIQGSGIDNYLQRNPFNTYEFTLQINENYKPELFINQSLEWQKW